MLRYDDSPRGDVLPFVPSVDSVLDVGCWMGAFGLALKQQRGVAEVWGLEPNPAQASAAGQRLDRVVVGTFPDAAAESPLSERTFGCITFCDSLEHMIDPWAALTAARQLLRPNGTVVASVPNVRHAHVPAELLRGRWSYRDNGILDRTHLRFFTRASLRELFEEAGFDEIQVNPINITSQGRIARVLRVLGSHGVDFRALQFVVVARANHRKPVLRASATGADSRAVEHEGTTDSIHRS